MAASREYFATLPIEKIGTELQSRVDNYWTNKFVQAINGRLNTAWHYYFGFDADGSHATSRVRRAGDENELADVRVNHSRALVNALLNLIIAAKFVWTPRAESLDYDDVRQCDLARAVLEHYWHNKKVGSIAGRAAEEAIVFTEGFVLVEWDDKAGAVDQEDPDTLQVPQPDPANPDAPLEAMAPGAPMFTGDLRFSNVSSWDVIRNPAKQSWEELDWVIVRVWRNRFDLAARYPDVAEKIIDLQADAGMMQNRVGTNYEVYDEDDVPLYIFYHKPSAVLPWGKEVRFLGDGTVLNAKNLDLETFPLHRVTPAELTGRPFGYSPYLEILGLQEVSDSVLSALTTNITTFGVQSIAAEEGQPLQVDELTGLRVIYYKGSKPPSPLSFLAASADQFSFLEKLKTNQELIMGLNAVVRGEAQSDRLSGAALALLQSQALQQASVLQGNQVKMLEGLGTTTIQLITKHATVPLKIAIVGKTNLSLAQETSVDGESLASVKQVYVELGNPISQTAAGRYDLAKELLKLGLIKTAEQLQSVLDTGRLDPVTRGSHEEYLLILRENEMLMKGEVPPAMIGDRHMLHGLEHSVVLASPTARTNPKIVEACRQHDMEHYSLYYNVPLEQVPMDPLYHDRLMHMKGQQPPPPVPVPMLPAGPQAGLQPHPGPQHPPSPANEGKVPEQKVDVPAAEGTPLAEHLPSQPVQPLTHERWDPATGGGQVQAPTPNK